MKAIVDKDACIGCGLCPSICPEVFSMDTDDKAVAIDDVIPDEHESAAQEASVSCPVMAISVE